MRPLPQRRAREAEEEERAEETAEAEETEEAERELKENEEADVGEEALEWNDDEGLDEEEPDDCWIPMLLELLEELLVRLHCAVQVGSLRVL
jgi:hypothetical protein